MILVVDDTAANIDIVLEIIGELDDIAVALNGEEALEIIAEDKPDLILLDIVMPGIDGFEVCRRIKADSATEAIPVVFLSGNDSSEEKSKAEKLGASGFLAKPINPEKLLETVRTFIQGGNNERS